VLSFVAEHKLVLTAHVQALLGVSPDTAARRLRRLASAGLLSGDSRVYRGYHQITRAGLNAAGSRLPRPREDLSTYWHDAGVAWLYLGARAGTFGALRAVISERQMRSSDASSDRPAEPFGVRLGGSGPGGRPRLHYPDLLLHTADGHRVAVELELSGKARTRREAILGGYSLDRRIDAVIYFVSDPAIGRAIAASAARLGISSMIHVQRFAWQPSHGPPERGAAAQLVPSAGRRATVAEAGR